MLLQQIQKQKNTCGNNKNCCLIAQGLQRKWTINEKLNTFYQSSAAIHDFTVQIYISIHMHTCSYDKLVAHTNIHTRTRTYVFADNFCLALIYRKRLVGGVQKIISL